MWAARPSSDQQHCHRHNVKNHNTKFKSLCQDDFKTLTETRASHSVLLPSCPDHYVLTFAFHNLRFPPPHSGISHVSDVFVVPYSKDIMFLFARGFVPTKGNKPASFLQRNLKTKPQRHLFPPSRSKWQNPTPYLGKSRSRPRSIERVTWENGRTNRSENKTQPDQQGD